MITEVIKFEDLDGNEAEEVANFHITHDALSEQITMETKLREMVEILSGPKRKLTTDEVQKLIDMVKWWASISYGIRSDSSHFEQDNPVGKGPIWNRFKSSLAWSHFLLSLFENPEKCLEFIVNVMPKFMREAAEKESGINLDSLKTKTDRLPPGSRIVDGVVELPPERGEQSDPAPVAPQPATDGVDYEALLAQMPKDPHPLVEKTGITASQAEFMKQQLSAKPGQYEEFMSTRFIQDS